MTISKKLTLSAIVTLLVVSGLLLAACSPAAEKENDQATEVTYTETSLIGTHKALNQDLTGLTEVSIASCTSEPVCHGGSWESIVEETEEFYDGANYSTIANPHASHASNAYECSDCHSLAGDSVAMCNSCHYFEIPSGWVEKPQNSAVWGNGLEPAYTGDGVVDPRAH